MSLYTFIVTPLLPLILVGVAVPKYIGERKWRMVVLSAACTFIVTPLVPVAMFICILNSFIKLPYYGKSEFTVLADILEDMLTSYVDKNEIEDLFRTLKMYLPVQYETVTSAPNPLSDYCKSENTSLEEPALLKQSELGLLNTGQVPSEFEQIKSVDKPILIENDPINNTMVTSSGILSDDFKPLLPLDHFSTLYDERMDNISDPNNVAASEQESTIEPVNESSEQGSNAPTQEPPSKQGKVAKLMQIFNAIDQGLVQYHKNRK